jgi:hypothetical protein
MQRRNVILLAGVLAALAPCLLFAGTNYADGEYAIPKRVPLTDPPPTVLWGPYAVPNLRGLQWGFYGMEYHGLYGRLYGVYFWQQNINLYRSTDSINPVLPETIPVSTITSPVADSFQDMAWCRYDNSIWLHSSKYKQVYKLDAATGTLKRQFPTPASRYPIGIAFDERAKEIYLIDRMPEGVFPCSLYVTDTLGNVLRRHSLDHLGYSYSGARCLDLDYSNANPNWPSILLTYTFFSGSGALDSVVLFELDRTSISIIHRQRLPDLSGYINNVRGVAWDPRTSEYWIGIMQNPDNYVYKMDGWYDPMQIDAGITTLVEPRGPADSGSSVVPQICVRNYGTSQITFPVRMRIGDDYDQTVQKTLAPVSEDTMTFPAWNPTIVGTHAVHCSTGLAGDMFPTNDTWLEYVRVTRPGRDVALSSIVTPVGFMDSGATVAPLCSVYNAGSVTVDYDVRMKIGSGYDQTAHVSGHIPGVLMGVYFPNWTAAALGTFPVSCSTRLTGDTLRSNDRLEDSVTVVVRDVGTSRIAAPGGVIDSGELVAPRSVVFNRGGVTESFWAQFRIHTTDGRLQVYSDSVWLSVQPGESVFADFDTWQASPAGVLRLESYTELGPDQYRGNDTAYGAVTVRRPVHDVGAVEIVAPSDTVDTGALVVPAALVQNFGTFAETFPVRFQIGAFYTSDTSLTLLAGASDTVWFAPWPVAEPGTHWVRCSTRLVGDVNNANDRAQDSVVVQAVGVVEAGRERPRHFALEAGRPNPFTGSVRIGYALPRDCRVAIGVYSSAGTLVRVLRDAVLGPGWGRVAWDGRDETGRTVSRGIYYCRLETEGFSALKKLVKVD